MFERSLEEERISYKTLEFSTGNSLRKCLQRGLGLTVCPTISIEKELQENSLQLLNWQEASTSVVMIWHVDKWCSPLLKRFMEIAMRLIY